MTAPPSMSATKGLVLPTQKSRSRRGSHSRTRRERTGTSGHGDPFVEVRLRSPSTSHWLGLIAQRPGVKVRSLVCRPSGAAPQRMLRLLEVEAEPEELSGVLQILRRAVRQGSLAVTPWGSHRLLVWASEPVPAICAAVFHAGAICTSCPLMANGRELPPEGTLDPATDWGLLLPRMSPRAKALLKVFGDRKDGEPVLLRVGGLQAKESLTPRQEHAVDVAFQMGYFHHPRQAGLREVALALGVSRSTALELLRRGLEKVLATRTGRSDGGLELPTNGLRVSGERPEDLPANAGPAA